MSVAVGTTQVVLPTGGDMPLRRLVRAYLMEAKYESLRMLRSPAFTVPFIGLPLLLYLFFGVFLARSMGGTSRVVMAVTLVNWSVYGMMGPGLFGFGITVAMERDQKLVTLKRALPAPPGCYLLGKMMMTLLFGAIVLALLVPAAVFYGHPGFTAGQYLALLVVDILGGLPFCALGLFIGTRCSGQAAPGVANLVFLPMMFLAGIFFPMPASVQWTAYLSPAYYLAQLALGAAGLHAKGPTLLHVTVLVVFTLVLTLSSVRRLARAG
ncbi:MAG TPA: ABC transporter permease [Armatimonadota bacterium]|jgi:ABC-2 type transport system permease protein